MNPEKGASRFPGYESETIKRNVTAFLKKGEGGFLGELDLRQHCWHDKTRWQLLAPLVYVTKNGDVITIPQNFQTDLASVPRVFWAILPPFGRYSKAAVLHDYLLVIDVGWRKANHTFFESIETLDLDLVTRWALKTGVKTYFSFKSRCDSFARWLRNRKNKEEEAWRGWEGWD